MKSATIRSRYIHFGCSHSHNCLLARVNVAKTVRRFSESAVSPQSQLHGVPDQSSHAKSSATTTSTGGQEKAETPGALSRRLSDMTERALDNAGSRGGKMLQETGFSDELKQQLQQRIQASEFTAEHTAAIAQVNMSVSERCITSHQLTRTDVLDGFLFADL